MNRRMAHPAVEECEACGDRWQDHIPPADRPEVLGLFEQSDWSTVLLLAVFLLCMLALIWAVSTSLA